MFRDSGGVRLFSEGKWSMKYSGTNSCEPYRIHDMVSQGSKQILSYGFSKFEMKFGLFENKVEMNRRFVKERNPLALNSLFVYATAASVFFDSM